ncbi:MAG: hypothetical protein IPN69_23140 [Acidobacteria bacterium]|nr:hypothetical protein [Acidobacteriota bacterium]MBK8813605.1 hypothetical protein [Acidobacteriota bacterium]
MNKLGSVGIVMMMVWVSIASAQSALTTISRIEIDGQEIKTKYRVFFQLNDKWIRAKQTKSGFLIPTELSGRESLSVLIKFRKYRLTFSGIHFSKFDESWVVGIDKKPFSTDLINDNDPTLIRQLYYIRFDGARESTILVVTKKYEN